MMAHSSSLPEADPALEALPPASRAQIAALWLSRARNELRTSSVFASLHRELMAFGAGIEVLEISARAVSDEVRHAALCAEVSARYSGLDVTLGSVSPLDPPEFSVCSGRVSRALFAALHSSVNETLATTYLGGCLEEATGAVAKAALREIISDEVRHARIGWAVLASDRLSASDRASISSIMPVLLDVCVSAWLAEVELDYPAELPIGHGCLRHQRIASLIDDTLQNVIAPGLDHVQIDSAPARAWIAGCRKR
jgi:hypothetical protein